MEQENNEFTIAIEGLGFCRDCKQRFCGCLIKEGSPASLFLTKIQIVNTMTQNRPTNEYYKKDRYKCVNMIHRDFRVSKNNSTVWFQTKFVEELKTVTPKLTNKEWMDSIGNVIKEEGL